LLLSLLSLVAVTLASYSTTTGLNLLYLSYAAYCPESQVSAWSCPFCTTFTSHNGGAKLTITSTVEDSSKNLFGYIGYSGSTAYVVFRGTVSTSLTNWYLDIDFVYSDYSIPSSFGTGEVHTGFYEAWTTLKPQVQAAIQALRQQRTISQIYFTGHSLGAAITMLGALEVGTTLGIPLTVYTYGEPRVGNEAFAHYWESKITNSFRVVNYDDIVPHLPTKDMGFWHTTTEIWYTTDTSYRTCDSSGEDPNCMNSLRYLWDYSVESHLDYLGVYLLDEC